MQYSKAMIDLVKEIRHRVPSETKPGIKFANPELLEELAQLYPHIGDTVCKVLIRELLILAERQELLAPALAPRQVYRGQAVAAAAGASAAPRANTTRYYRGQPVLS